MTLGSSTSILARALFVAGHLQLDFASLSVEHTHTHTHTHLVLLDPFCLRHIEIMDSTLIITMNVLDGTRRVWMASGAAPPPYIIMDRPANRPVPASPPPPYEAEPDIIAVAEVVRGRLISLDPHPAALSPPPPYEPTHRLPPPTTTTTTTHRCPPPPRTTHRCCYRWGCP